MNIIEHKSPEKGIERESEPVRVPGRFRAFFQIDPLSTPTAAARAYVPVVFFNRGLAMVRLLLVTWILGSAGKTVFGQYQLALEVLNWLGAIALFGLADAAERYAAHHEHQGDLAPFLRRQWMRLCITSGGLGLLLCAAAPKLGNPLVIVTVALNLVALVPYQWLAGVLRGLRAYRAAAGMESCAALLALALAALAAWRGTTWALLLAYFAANALAFLYFGLILRRHVKTHAVPAASSDASPDASSQALTTPSDRFARWALVRLLLTMSFGLVALWSVKYLCQRVAGVTDHGDAAAADFAMPYRAAQLLAYAAVTLWASNYGLAAKNWAHGRRNRARVELLRLGKWGGVGLLTLALAFTFFRASIATLVHPTYSAAINQFLPALTGIFLWYGMLTFLITLGDLQERPWIGVLLWAAVLVTQIAGIALAMRHGLASVEEAQWAAIYSAGAGFAIACLLLAPAFLWRPARMTATAVPIGLLLLCAVVFFTPLWVVGSLALVAYLLITGFLWVSGLLIR